MKRLFFLGLIIAFLSLSLPSNAGALQYSVNGWDRTPSNLNSPEPERYYWMGTGTSNYVMANPTITAARVNSIYVREHGDYNGYEFGWVWEKGKQPQWFAVT